MVLSHYCEPEKYNMSDYVAADFVSNLFEPDIILPTQINGVSERGICGGERRLMAALLSDGIEAYVSQCRGVRSRWTHDAGVDAEEWIDNNDQSYVFSFDVVCECLGIDPQYLRSGLKRYVSEMQNYSIHANEIDEAVTAWKKIRRPRI